MKERRRPGRHWIGGKKAGKVVSVQRNIFWRKNIGDDQTYLFSRVELTSAYRDQLLVSHQKETTLQHFTTFYNILQHFTTFYNIYNILQHTYNIYNILQHYPWRCVVFPEGW